ncbi:zinc finger protein OZF-like isoform X7 [Cydia splendana]|uniref:zinc finger protein OZF-like isoform X7 n=1 Tax=Cydia splendana TaxID=1100963 RepID=UPI00300C6F60
MDFDEIVVKESPGLCRCCLSEGCYKDLGSEYSWMSETEIYADMLLECFDISISQHPTGPNGSNRLICEVCITRLRDACNFKKQVLESEKKFVDMVGRGEFRPKVLLYQTQMKTERVMELEEETGADDSGEVEYLEEDADFVDEELLKNEDYGEASVSEDITVSTLAVKGKRGRPKKAAAKPEKKAKVAKTEEKPKKAVAKDATVPSDHFERARKRQLLHQIIHYSTAMPFRRAANIYKCFYCYKNINKASDLREHHDSHVDDGLKFRTVKRCAIQFPTCLDITDLKCNLCHMDYDDLKTFLIHLQEDHKKIFSIEATKHIECYKISDGNMKCLICDETFEYFYPLLIHTVRSHRESVLKCETCGQSFSCKYGLKKHQTTHETPEIYPCRHCEKTFTSTHNRREHEKRIHDEKARKCHICGEILGSTFKKAMHLENVHNVMGEFKCETCPKTFRLRNHLVSHVQRVHLKERNKVCMVCGDKFYNNNLLKLHMVRHSDEKPFECEICNKKFTRKKGLDIHVRTHTGDKRCVCQMCGAAFVQTTSLKLHLRVHHGIEKKTEPN